jgi:hypothetical protein
MMELTSDTAFADSNVVLLASASDVGIESLPLGRQISMKRFDSLRRECREFRIIDITRAAAKYLNAFAPQHY